ncbi:hypothetical protein [Paenibacillus alkalitolerans]|uniref:hypothetical protein n=1 Tax=Paenibacillus alkalitolerans TaxID=2799335 RepID=UPI0018F3AAE2|nr:hypothetical protein [Paenibacillus alkalitolerans]
MSNHIFIATMKPIEDLKYVFERYNFGIGSGEDYRIGCNLPLTLPYVYEIYGYEKLSLISFLEEFMEFGDVVEIYEYWEGQALPESINVPKEARTINLLQRTYKDEFGEYQFDKRNWMEELATRTVVSNRSVTTFVKY